MRKIEKIEYKGVKYDIWEIDGLYNITKEGEVNIFSTGYMNKEAMLMWKFGIGYNQLRRDI